MTIMLNNKNLEHFRDLRTPFYYYDLDILRATLEIISKEAGKNGYKVHYAVKANANSKLLNIISSYGFGADCVSWNEIERALSTGFKSSEIVFAGVGKTDFEIENALAAGILCFNVESIPEMEVIDILALKQSKIASIALRINPDIEAHTHKYITTGIEETKFGINMRELENVLNRLSTLKNIKLIGLHFHVGSQITKMSVFRSLCDRINELQDWFKLHYPGIEIINAGGGLGINYEDPEKMPDFEEYFSIFRESVVLNHDQILHFEPGRSVVGQCGSLISKVLYIKNGNNKKFAVIDAGMTDLIRPALYQAHHKIENLTSNGEPHSYDIVGPICESSDTFARDIEMPEIKRGDVLAIRSAGAYGEAMASKYNLRDLPYSVFSDEF
jgi:diaminopimelate decarboxylase